ncbi:hypothetical protein FA13DRAFT_1802579 [Coprinellus micaceus]|uniref:Uncharacterized protein n=1 Tax=Coprinellus micaceus TaxID=71717 RepID=A0A4Y7SCV6_COPMI|nr:hypothetical protein FA13DRAFT_1802579 [Coprinellus micaceus]
MEFSPAHMRNDLLQDYRRQEFRKSDFLPDALPPALHPSHEGMVEFECTQPPPQDAFHSARRSPQEDLAEFQRVAGILCVYLLAVRNWRKASSGPDVSAADAALERLCHAESFVYGLLDELHTLQPSSESLVIFFVEDMFHTGRFRKHGSTINMSPPIPSSSAPDTPSLTCKFDASAYVDLYRTQQ